ncbi:MAG: hypothetical protein ACRD0W_24570, partial [Acidimicrobiales bacterium]
MAEGHLPLDKVTHGRPEGEGGTDRFRKRAPRRLGPCATQPITERLHRRADLRHLAGRPRIVRTDRAHPAKRTTYVHQSHS